jgi:hypothetical protein
MLYIGVIPENNMTVLELDPSPTWQYFKNIFRDILEIQGYSEKSVNFQKFILQKLLTLNPCPVYGWKGNLSKF